MSASESNLSAGIAMQPGMHIHLVGIGGAGISCHRPGIVGIKLLLVILATSKLLNCRLLVRRCRPFEHIAGARLLRHFICYSHDNPEVVAARAADVPVQTSRFSAD